MGLGPSIKMTSLHHYNCPICKLLLKDGEVDFAGVLVDGVSEGCDDKLRTAELTAIEADRQKWDGAIVAIDGWGNHHVDFVGVISELEKRGITTLGLSYIGLQGRLVCTDEYVGTIVDFNKEESGYETCMVGQNNLTEDDAYKAVGILKSKLKKRKAFAFGDRYQRDSFNRIDIPVEKVTKGPEFSYDKKEKGLTINKDLLGKLIENNQYIEEASLSVIEREKENVFLHSNLDFMPLATMVDNDVYEITSCKAMITGVENHTGYEPSNIGSSEGMMFERVYFDREGTPCRDDYILSFEYVFKEGTGKSKEAIIEAHRLTDEYLNEIRACLKEAISSIGDESLGESQSFSWTGCEGAMKIGLVKIVSGLGHMYDTAVFPKEPAGVIGSTQMRDRQNDPVMLTPLQVLQGKIHSFL